MIIDEFGKQLVLVVRDRALEDVKQLLDGEMEDAQASKWREFASGDGATALRELIPDVVDQVIFRLLHAIDNEELQLSYTSEVGELANLCEAGLGELAGWYDGGEGSWISLHSHQPHNDYCVE
jgi:hypothetical protein